jgi:hypothetical protein
MNKTGLILAVMIVAMAGKAQASPVIDLRIIGAIESNSNVRAVNKREGAYGIYQIRQAVIDDFNKLSRSRRKYRLEDMLDQDKAYTVANWYLHDRIPKMLRYYKLPVTKERVIWGYNAGIKAVLDGRMPNITREYINKYNKMESEHNGL